MKSTSEKKNEILEQVIMANACVYYTVNLTKNIVPGYMKQIINDKQYNINEYIGLKTDADFSDVIAFWDNNIEDAAVKSEFLNTFDINNLISQYESGKKHITMEYWTQTALHKRIYAQKNIYMYKDDDSEDICGIVYIMDKTKEVQKEQYYNQLAKKSAELNEMLKEEHEYGLIMGALSKIYWQIYSVDLIRDSYKLVYNGRDFNIKSMDKEGIAQERFMEAVKCYVSDEYKDKMGEFLNHKTLAARLSDADSISVEYVGSDGKWYCASYVIQERDMERTPIKVLFTLKEITERKVHELKQQELLKESANAAKAANRSKSAFLYNMSHDIRTPLNGIIGLLEINKKHMDDLKLIADNHDKMLVAANHLLSLINDVLQVSKLEGGTVEIENEPVDLMDVSKEIGAIIMAKTMEDGITLGFGKQDIKARYVYSSALHLRQIFLNIYGNCIKYNRQGGSIETSMECLLYDKEKVVYRWTISDTGVGMDKEFVEHIFEPFVQEDKDARSIYHGTGLGMTIVKRLIENMNGKVSVSSTKDVGTSFVVTIPFKIAPKPQKAIISEEDADIEGTKILLVEDNELNAEIAETILRDNGAFVTTVTDGAQAVDAFSSNPEKTFDLILMDIMMPVMNGYEATKNIRNLDRKDAKEIPIIAMTANAFKEDEEKCIKAGMNAHIAKPVKVKSLIEIISILKNGGSVTTH